MELQKLVLVVLEKLKVDFQRTQSVFASCARVDYKSRNHNIRGLFFDFCDHTMRFDLGAKAWFKWYAGLDECSLQVGNIVKYIETKRIIFLLGPQSLCCASKRVPLATGHFPVPPLQQVKVSIRTSRSFNQKLRKSRLELTEINLRLKLFNHVMYTTFLAKRFAKASSSSKQPFGSRTRWLPARIVKSIQQFICRHIMRIMPAWLLAFPGIANNLFCYYKGSFDLYVVVIFKLSGLLTHWHAACFGLADFHICLDSSTS